MKMPTLKATLVWGEMFFFGFTIAALISEPKDIAGAQFTICCMAALGIGLALCVGWELAFPVKLKDEESDEPQNYSSGPPVKPA